MFRKTHLALIAILVAALLGAFASSMIPTSGFQLSNVTMESFTILADKVTIKADGRAKSMELTIDTVLVDGTRRNVAVIESAAVEIEGMTLIKREGNRTVEIKAASASGTGVDMTITSLVAKGNSSFTGLTMTDIPIFLMSTSGKVTMANVTITCFSMFAEAMTIYEMELTVS